jgi:large subunit ribosomal protein L23
MPHLDPRQVVLKPIVTEKSQLDSERRRAYHFMVHPQANKVQIRTAVEKVFNVKVVDVRTQIRPGKRRRLGFTAGSKPPWKRAVVTLREGDMIEVV